MRNRLPQISGNHKICIICEGNEEYRYLERLKELKVWNKIYDISLVNAAGNGNISSRYQDRYQNNSYELVLIFCDTEKKPHQQYHEIKSKIDEFHGIDNISHELIIFGNPCTLQIIMKHWTDENIVSPAKKRNAELIRVNTGIEKYKAKEEQIKQLMKYITVENYKSMCKRVKILNKEDNQPESTNFGRFIEYFSSDKDNWITEINKKVGDISR